MERVRARVRPPAGASGLRGRKLRVEVTTFLLAGQETTSLALTWTWYLLSQHPAAARRLEAEIDKVLGGRPPAYWKDPETFDPERFSAQNSAERPKFVYLPFGAGPRQCIGNQFALIEAQLSVATLAQRYRLRLVPGHRVEPWPLITRRPRYGMPMFIERRQTADKNSTTTVELAV